MLCIIAVVAWMYFWPRHIIDNFQGMNQSKLELVVANYEENLDWISTIPPSLYDKLTIYNKGSYKNYSQFIQKGARTYDLHNVGREGHTYLYHIVNNFDNLSEVTMFLPGSTNTFYQKQAQLDLLLEGLKEKKDSIVIGFNDPVYIKNELTTFKIDEYEITSSENKRVNPKSSLTPSHIRPLGRWIESRFPGEELTCIGYRGLVVASRDDILKRPKSFYEGLMAELNYNNPEVGHYIERAWPLILSIPTDKCGNGDFMRRPKGW